MTSVRAPRRIAPPATTSEQAAADFRQEDEVCDLTCPLLDAIGRVQKGSLEEAIWGELGALPKSRARGSL